MESNVLQPGLHLLLPFIVEAARQAMSQDQVIPLIENGHDFHCTLPLDVCLLRFGLAARRASTAQHGMALGLSFLEQLDKLRVKVKNQSSGNTGDVVL